MSTIDNLSHFSLQEVYESFNRAFFDYEVKIDKSSFENMLKRRGYNPQLSFGAFDNGKLVSFILNGIGNYNGLSTAYDTGTGTIPEYRKKGLVQQIFHYSLPYLKKASVKQYLLEVIQHNTNAVNLYKKLGFKITREFNYFVQNKSELKFPEITVSENVIISEISLKEARVLENAQDFELAWQNSFKAVERSIDDFKILGAFSENQLVACCILEPESGDLTQIAVKKSFRRKGVATALLHEILKSNQHHSIKIINTQVDCVTITKFLSSRNIPLKGKQYEMVKYL